MMQAAIAAETIWHNQTGDQTLSIFGVDPKSGLPEDEVQSRRHQYGLNVLTAKKGKGPLERFFLQFHSPLIYILIVAAVITLFLKEWVDSSVIFGVVLINSIIGFIQESKALSALEALSKTMTTQAVVLRGGRQEQVASTELVPGDIVLLTSGDKVPADIRLIHGRELQVSESALTGESVPVKKNIAALESSVYLGDRSNMAFASTFVTYGQGRGVVVATGDRTEVGKISELISAADNLDTPLTKKFARFSQFLLYVILALAVLTFLIGVFRGQPAADMFMVAVALAVSAIPEGLPAAVTITLAIGVSRMARRRAIIRRLPAVETLGSTTVICSDKTGTLTENQMTVQEIFSGKEFYAVSGTGYDPAGQITRDGQSADSTMLTDCLKAGLLCNDSKLVKKDGRFEIQGDPTEGALIVAAHKASMDAEAVDRQLPRIDAIPFESEYQYMATLHDTGSGQPRIAYLKGAVETILSKCSTSEDKNGVSGCLDTQEITREAECMASKGLRVLAFAKRSLPPDKDSLKHEDLSSDLVFLGLQGMMDPPRQEAMQAVQKCHTAGISVKMITGDHGLTASAIAEKIGIGKGVAVTGKELERLSDEQIGEVADKTSIFARVTPEQKLRLVKMLQKRGHIVAMTGDGVNDAPALKQADIGVAMGLSGTEVAKESADIVLTDDNFASIEAAVEEGRCVFDNLTKFIMWTLPTNLGECLAIMVAVFFGLQLPVAPIHILWINMTTAIFLGMMLAFEPGEDGLMRRPPHDPQMPILKHDLMMRTAFVGILMATGVFGLFYYESHLGASLEEARTAAVGVLVVGELFYLFNCRSFKRSMFSIGLFSNKWIWPGVFLMILLQLLFTYAPIMNQFFHSAPLSLESWIRIVAVGVGIYFAVGFEKWLRFRSA